MKNTEQVFSTFEMIPEGENSLSIKRVYPESISSEEREKAEKTTPEVILRCFNAADIKELQELGEKLVKQHFANNNGTRKRVKVLNLF